ncbi:MAG: hypothetical protein V8Q86_09995 [Blautia sp.]
MKKKMNIDILVTTYNVGMDKRKDVIVIENKVEKMSEENIRKWFEIVEKQNQQMKKQYYASNTPIIITKQRKFKDLVKKFLLRTKRQMKVERRRVVLKRG